jgi:crotonobetainyl-CoA:carnitine CoA-transferase CaiB-like acyl-CoA transferase
VFATSDGFIMLSIANDPTFKRFCENVGLAHLVADPRFATNPARVENREAVTAALAPVMKSTTTAAWVTRLEELKVGCGPINTVREAFADPQVVARGAVVHMPHPSTPDGVDVIANPVRLSETPADYRLPPPLLGQHTDEILSERLGFDDAKLAALRKNGVI